MALIKFLKTCHMMIFYPHDRSHVWAQFCLCYEGQKLLDQDNVGLHGIKDGDQVCIHPYNDDIKSLFLLLLCLHALQVCNQCSFAYAYVGVRACISDIFIFID